MTEKQAAGFRVKKKKKTDLVICVWVRPVTRAVEPTEVVIVAISNIFLFFNLKRKRGNEQLKQLERMAHVANTSGRRDSKRLTGFSWQWKPPNFLFPQSQRKFLQE